MLLSLTPFVLSFNTPPAMNTTVNARTRLNMLVKRIKNRLIASVVPPHLRRAIFTCSLAAHLTPNDNQQHLELAKTLCKDLDLVCTYNAMLAPMSWNDRIWRELPDLHLSKETQGSALVKAASTVIMNSPASLRYASPRIMIEDTVNTLRTVLRNQQNQLRA